MEEVFSRMASSYFPFFLLCFFLFFFSPRWGSTAAGLQNRHPQKNKVFWHFFFNYFDHIVDNYHTIKALQLTPLANYKLEAVVNKEDSSLATFTVVAGAYTSSTGTSSTVT